MPALSPRRPLLYTLALPTLLASAIAQAQDGPAARTLDKVTVVAERASTATKTDTALTETPQAISVVTQQLFTDRGAHNLQEVLRYSAGVTADAWGLDTRNDATSVRGLDPVQYQDGLRRSYGFSPSPARKSMAWSGWKCCAAHPRYCTVPAPPVASSMR